MINKSIAYRLGITITLAVVAVFVGFILVFYAYNYESVKENIKNKAIGKSSEVIMLVEKQLVSTHEISSNIADQIVFYCQHDHPQLLLRGLIRKYPFINSIRVNLDSIVPDIDYRNYYCYKDSYSNKIILEKGNREVYNCMTEKAFVKQAASKKQASWTEAFVCSRNDHLVVSFYSPVMQKIKGEQIQVGEVVCELSLVDLNTQINNVEIEGGGFAFMISKTGDYLTHPDESMIYTKNIFTLDDGIYNKNKVDVKKILNEGLSGSLISYPDYLDNKKAWTYYTPIVETGWFLIYAVPYAALFNPLYLAILKMLFFSAIGILAIYIIITYISNRLVKPLSTVTNQLKKFSSDTGDFELDTLNEIKLVSESLAYLKSWYEQYKVNESEKDKIDTRRRLDLLEASEIQKSLIKTDFSEFKNRNDIDIYASYRPAKIVSGDLFDYFFLDKETLIFSIGDVSGKGVPAAFFMSIAQTIIKSNASQKRASKIVDKTNLELHTNNHHQFFLTLFLGVLNLRTGILNYCNAAHTATYIVRKNGDIVELVKSHGMPLGLYANKPYKDSEINIHQDDLIVLYTDGVTETINANEELFGNIKLKSILSALEVVQPKQTIKNIEKNVAEYRGKQKQIDDITLLSIKYKKRPV